MEYFELTGYTLLRYTDEVTEAVHSQLQKFEERHKLNRIDIADKVMLSLIQYEP